MFKNLRNNYYFGKAGTADYTVDDMPANRWQLFWVTLKTRLGTMLRVNLLYALVFIPMLVVLVIYGGRIWNVMVASDQGDGTSLLSISVQQQREAGEEVSYSEDDNLVIPDEDANQLLQYNILWMLIWLFPCVAITGPFTAGVSYLTRNWARDEHAFAWTDFKDAFKDNWKQALPVSAITGLIPLLVYMGVVTYREMAITNALFIVPEAIVILVGVLWAISVTYMYPLMVTYELSFKDLMRNAFLLGVARLPTSVGVRLLHCVPVALAVAAATFFPTVMNYAMMLLFLWYALIGLMISRFITSSYTNAVFDRFINPRIEGAKVNQGLHTDDDLDEEEEQGREKTDSDEFSKPEA